MNVTLADGTTYTDVQVLAIDRYGYTGIAARYGLGAVADDPEAYQNWGVARALVRSGADHRDPADVFALIDLATPAGAVDPTTSAPLTPMEPSI